MPLVRFRRDININGKTFHLLFYGLDTSNGKRLLVVCHDGDRGDVHIVFHMVENKNPGGWKVMSDAPYWIIAVEKRLSSLVEKAFKSNKE